MYFFAIFTQSLFSIAFFYLKTINILKERLLISYSVAPITSLWSIVHLLIICELLDQSDQLWDIVRYGHSFIIVIFKFTQFTG